MKFAKSLEIPHGDDFAMAMYFMVVFVLFFFTHPESNFYPYRVPGGIPAGSRRGPARPRLVVCAPQLVAVTLCALQYSRNALHASIERVASFRSIVRSSLNSPGPPRYGQSARVLRSAKGTPLDVSRDPTAGKGPPHDDP